MRSHARVLYDWDGRKITDLSESKYLCHRPLNVLCLQEDVY